MSRESRPVTDWTVIGVAAVGIGAVVWLAPLMAEQIVFFGDREQTRVAQVSRLTMLPVAAVLGLVAAALARHAGIWHGALAALPALTAVPLAWIAPGPAYQVLVYAATAPIALGALTMAAVPRVRHLVGRR